MKRILQSLYPYQGGYSMLILRLRRPVSWLPPFVLLAAVTVVLQGCADIETTPVEIEKTQVEFAPFPLPRSNSPEGLGLGDRRLTELPNGLYLEELSGESARRHLEQLMSRRPNAFANISLAAKGYIPTEHVVVQRISRIPTQLGASQWNSFFTQTYEEYDAEGEIMFWSWDNGDDNTWEGVIWFEHYASGLAGTNEAQFDVSNEEHPMMWLDNTWESSGGGGDGDGDHELVEMVRWSGPRCGTGVPGVRFASLGTGSVTGTYALAAGFDWGSWGRCTGAWTVAGCSGAAVACIAAGPKWAPCFGFGCAGAFVAAAVGCALQ